MSLPLRSDEVFGLVRPTVDAHTLGISHVAKLLIESGYQVVIAHRDITDAVNDVMRPASMQVIKAWITRHRLTRLGLSYRLDPVQAADVFARLFSQLRDGGILGEGPGHVRGVYFAGLPEACNLVSRRHQGLVPVFRGDESPTDTLRRFGVPAHRIPAALSRQSSYDDERMAFARDLVGSSAHLKLLPEDRSGYPGYGSRTDHLISRIDHAAQRSQSPLMRVHVGPFFPEREYAIELFISWMRQLGREGFLDIASIGTSQLTQERFGEDWKGAPNGGGVPINSEEEYHRIWAAARPMLVRTYAGTQRIPELARIHERTLNTAWHALSFWWFSRIDGRGPHSVRQNLQEHLETLDFIASTRKPFEPNIPHHFAFRGGDDVTYIVSAVLAARTAKSRGVRYFVLQNMLNTPKFTLGVQDLAKARAMLHLVRELEDKTFRVILQPRAGLDYLSPDLEKAKVQLAAVSVLMDDIEPQVTTSPEVVHVVSYPEASHLATPLEINESIQITRKAIDTYRQLRRSGRVADMSRDADVACRTAHLLGESRTVLAAIEQTIPNPYSADGLYRVLAAGYLAAPYLWEERKEFRHAVEWRTAMADGGVAIVDGAGSPVSAAARVARVREHLLVERRQGN
jgi:hypothetical protein